MEHDDLAERLGIEVDTDYEGDRIYLRVRLLLDGAEVASDSVALPDRD